MKLAKATTGDVALSVIIPGWGVLVGLMALMKDEGKRGLTMIGISVLMLAIIGIIRA